MLKKILSRGEVIAVVMMAGLAFIMGGWQIMITAVLAGVLIGLSSRHGAGTILRSALVGLGVSILIVAVTHFHNTVLNALPGQETIPPEAMTFQTYLIAIAACVGFSVLTAFIHNLQNERARQLAILVMLAVIAIAFPFFEQCPGLAWAPGKFQFADMADGCAVKSNLLWIGPVIVMFIYGLQAMGLNIVAGYAGLLDLGYVAFFAIGAYTMGLLNSAQLGNQIGSPTMFVWGFWLVIWFAAAAAAFAGLLFGAPTLRLRGDYLAIVTLGFGEIVPIVVKNLYAVKIFEPISLFIAQITGKTGPAMEQAALCFVGCFGKPIDVTAGTKGISPIFAPPIFDYSRRVCAVVLRRVDSARRLGLFHLPAAGQSDWPGLGEHSRRRACRQRDGHRSGPHQADRFYYRRHVLRVRRRLLCQLHLVHLTGRV